MSNSIRNLSSDLQIKCANELNESPKSAQEELTVLRKWLQSQSHLCVRNEDQWLLSFLRGCKFRLKRVKDKLTTFYTMRTTLPEFFSNRDPCLKEIQDVLKLGILLPLRSTIFPGGPRIVLLRCAAANPSNISIVSAIKTSFMIIDILMNEDDNFIIGGLLGFLDMKGFTLNHMRQVTPSICRKIVICLQNAYPARPQGFHFINTPSIFETTYRLLKPLLTKRNRERVSFHSEYNPSSLYKHVPLEVLPKEYGGNGDCIVELTAYWKKKVEDYRDWFAEDEKYGLNEKSSYREFDSGYGSFRQLEID